MIHFLYLLGFSILVGLAFGVFSSGTTREKTLYGLKIFGQFMVVSIALAWLFYFLPW
jgi:hypothetical protein